MYTRGLPFDVSYKMFIEGLESGLSGVGMKTYNLSSRGMTTSVTSKNTVERAAQMRAFCSRYEIHSELLQGSRRKEKRTAKPEHQR